MTNSNKHLPFWLVVWFVIFTLTACGMIAYPQTNPGIPPAPIIANTQSALRVVVLAVMLFGLFSLITQVIPGLAIIWLSALAYGVVTGFNGTAILLFILITGLMILGSFMDEILMGARAHKSGANWLTIFLAILAGTLGSIQFPPFGGLVAALLVLFSLESMRLKDWRKAFSSTRQMAVGCGYAFFARVGIGIVMILVWGLWVYLQ